MPMRLIPVKLFTGYEYATTVLIEISGDMTYDRVRNYFPE